MNKLLPFLVISLFFLGLIPIGSSTVTVYTGNYFYVGNETYGVTQTMVFSYIEHNSNWIRFNDTYFNVTSANPIYINLSFLHEDISMAANNTLLLQFNASTTGGTVWFNISGFVPTSQYYYKNASGIGNSINADVNGIISFNHSSWSEVLFEVYASYPPGDPGGYTNITQPPINATASPTLIEVMGNFDVGNYTTNTSVDVYAPVGWSVSFVNMSFVTATGAIDQDVTATTYSQYNASYRRYNYTYNPSNTLLDADMGNFSVNVSVIAYNLTHQYNNFTLFSDVFEVYRLNNPYNITALYNQTYHGLNFTWSGGGNVTYLTLRPMADAGPNDWYATSASHYTCVDELVCNESDYLYYYPIHSYFVYDMFEMANHTTETGNIVNVTAIYITKSNPYSGALIHPRMDIGGTTYYGNEITVSSTSYASYSYTWELNPDTGTNWTWGDIDDMELGIGQKVFSLPGRSARVAQIYSSIRYVGPTPSQTVSVRNNESFPVDPWNGYTVYNGTGNAFGNHPISDITYFTFYSYNDTTGSFSPGVQVNWGTLGLNCFNESNPSQAIGFDIEISNSDTSITYTASDLTNTHFINLDDIPFGDDTIFVISNSSYRQRVYYYDLVANQFYNYTFYLPPVTTPVDPGSGDDGGNTTATILCLISVIDEMERSVPNATVNIKRYINTTDSYENIAIQITDGNGEFTEWLIPNTLYRFEITKSGYIQMGSKFWTPTALEYSKTFLLEFAEVEDETIWTNINWSIEPTVFDHWENFTMYFNISSNDNQLEWFSATAYYYNNITESWYILYTESITTSSNGGSISYTTMNGTGKYGFQCKFKKLGYDTYTFGSSHSANKFVFTFWPEGSSGSSYIDDIITNVVGGSPVYVGETIVAYSALILAFVVTFFLFNFSPRFAGFSIMFTGLVIGAFKQPLNLINDDVINFLAVATIVFLGFLTIIYTRKKG